MKLIIENELIGVKWTNHNRQWYEDLGYIYTKRNDDLQVLAKDVSHGSRISIPVVCDYCGELNYPSAYQYYTQISNQYAPKYACVKCAGHKNSEVRLKAEWRKVLPQLESICNDEGYILITTENQYKGKKENFKYICPKHGEQTQMVDNFLRGHRCFYCSYDTRFDNVRKSTEEIKNGIENINNNIWLNPGDFKNVLTPNLQILCGTCGKNKFNVSYSNYIGNGINKCRSCSRKESVGERMIKDYLTDNQIRFKPEKRFDDCKDKKKLPFDFYLIDYNALIEFDGEQHYWNVFGESQFRNTKKHDEIKNHYCHINNIPLLRIPYWYRDDINEFTKILDNFINQIKNTQIEDIV